MTLGAVRQELELILASRAFTNSPRLARLLRYIAEKSAAADRESLKEYSIGLDVFDRDSSFDPKVDSIVRSTARQLRLKLADYYQSEGRDRPVGIELRKGSYVAEWRPRSVELQAFHVPGRTSPFRKSYLVAALLAVSLAAVLGAALVIKRYRPVHPRTLTVLPLRDLSPHGELAYIAEGLRDGLTSALVRTPGLEITARLERANPDASKNAAGTASSETFVTGSVAPAGDLFVATLYLIDGATGRYLWSQTYQGRSSDMAAIEHGAASGVAVALGASADPPAPLLPHNAEALDLFLRASTLSRTRQPAAMREAAVMFERVIGLEPGFALGYASAAANYLVAVANGVMAWNESGPHGIELARKAVALDPSLAEAHSALGLGMEDEWRWEEAGAELSRALELDPRSPVAYFRKAVDLASRGRFEEAQRNVEVAEVLDPSWSAPDGLRAEIYYYTRRWDDALALARKIRATWKEASTADNISWRTYIAQGEWQRARPFVAGGADALSRAWARTIDGDPGGAWRELLATRGSQHVPAFWLAAFAQAGLHDRDLAQKWLEQSWRDHEPDLVSLAIDPMFDEIRSTPAVESLLREMNLDPQRAGEKRAMLQ